MFGHNFWFSQCIFRFPFVKGSHCFILSCRCKYIFRWTLFIWFTIKHFLVILYFHSLALLFYFSHFCFGISIYIWVQIRLHQFRMQINLRFSVSILFFWILISPFILSIYVLVTPLIDHSVEVHVSCWASNISEALTIFFFVHFPISIMFWL